MDPREGAVIEAAARFAECVYEACTVGAGGPPVAAPPATATAADRRRQEFTLNLTEFVARVALEAIDVADSATTRARTAYGLTNVEARVAMLLAQRKTTHEIASELNITGHTARRHTEHVMKKLRIHSRRDVARSLLRLA